MPNIERASTGRLDQWLENLEARQIQGEARQIEALLGARSVSVRMEAARALGRAGIGAKAIRTRIKLEKNELVLTDLTEALLSARDMESLGLLQKLASTHRSQLVRSYSLMAFADLTRKKSTAFLRSCLAREKSRRVQATLLILLFVYGANDVLDDLLRALRSRDPVVRHKIVNMLRDYAPRRKRKEFLAGLRAAAEVETMAGIKQDMAATISALAG